MQVCLFLLAMIMHSMLGGSKTTGIIDVYPISHKKI